MSPARRANLRKWSISSAAVRATTSWSIWVGADGSIASTYRWGPPISQSAWIASTRRSRSRYSGSCLSRSFCSTRSVNTVPPNLSDAKRSAAAATQAMFVRGRSVRLRRVARRQVEEAGAWRALAACVVTIVLVAGSRTSLAAFLRPIEADLHLDRTVLSTAGALTVLTYGVAQPVVGALASRFGPRNVMIGGILLTAVGGFGLSTANQPWQLYVFAGIVPGLAFAGASSVPAAVLLAGWFVGRLGFATGIVSAAIPAGQSLFVPLATALIPAFGWRETYILLGLLVAGIGLPILVWLARDP